ncbi:hypothetical protein QN409_25710, partial [Pseudomonas sp. MH9.3]|uniref:hypothetical protein n=1 Tax=Pseudomonas sp. MH9.3 TaxID=3048630 RepID=UPI002B235449
GTPIWLIMMGIFYYGVKVVCGATMTYFYGLCFTDAFEAGEVLADLSHECFIEFAESIMPQCLVRASICAGFRLG